MSKPNRYHQWVVLVVLLILVPPLVGGFLDARSMILNRGWGGLLHDALLAARGWRGMLHDALLAALIYVPCFCSSGGATSTRRGDHSRQRKKIDDLW
jgi:hypothetical protein